MFKSNLVLSLIAIIILLIIAIPSQLLFNNTTFQAQLSHFIPAGINGAILLFLLIALLTSVGLPRQIGAFICGYCFDFIWGTVIVTFAATFGCWLTFRFANKFLPRLVKQHFAKQQQLIHTFLAEQLFYKSIIIRLLPIGSNFLTNLIAGACQLNAQPFILGSFIGFIPQMVIFSLAGAGVKLASSIHLIASCSLFIIAFLLSYYLYNQSRNQTPS